MASTLAWLLLLEMVGCLELAPGQAGSLFARPSQAIRRLAQCRLGRVLLIGAWLFLGWHLFARYTVA